MDSIRGLIPGLRQYDQYRKATKPLREQNSRLKQIREGMKRNAAFPRNPRAAAHLRERCKTIHVKTDKKFLENEKKFKNEQLHSVTHGVAHVAGMALPLGIAGAAVLPAAERLTRGDVSGAARDGAKASVKAGVIGVIRSWLKI